MLDSLIIQDRPPDSTNPDSAVGAIETFDAGWMKSARQLGILAVAPRHQVGCKRNMSQTGRVMSPLVHGCHSTLEF
jgi:hypothetical protein